MKKHGISGTMSAILLLSAISLGKAMSGTSFLTQLVSASNRGSQMQAIKSQTENSADCPEGPLSSLWGCQGELWDPRDAESRLQDWSYAGYQFGEPIPDVPVSVDVKRDFGAKGDNFTDDTKAFEDAISKTKQGAIYVPPGVYRITRKLRLKANTVLRGAGPESTTLFFPSHLTSIYNNSWNYCGTPHLSDYCWDQGFIEIVGGRKSPAESETTLQGKLVGRVTRGSKVLKLDHVPSSLKPGMEVALEQNFTTADGALSRYLMGDLLPKVNILEKSCCNMLYFISRVESVDLDANTVTLERHLPYEARPEWGAELHVYAPKVHHVGVEGLRLEMAFSKFNGHHVEHGWNGIFMQSVGHCWVKDVHIHNADNAILIKRSYHNTVQRIQVTAGPRSVLRSNEDNGHIGLGAKGGGDNLFTDFHVKGTMYHHDCVVDSETMSVFSNGRGYNLKADHHRLSPYSTLWTNLSAGHGQRLFHANGPPSAGVHTAAYTTYWGVRSQAPSPFSQTEAAEYGPLVNIIGVPITHTVWKSARVAETLIDEDEYGRDMKWWIEPAAITHAKSKKGLLGGGSSGVHPMNLHEAMVARRLARQFAARREAAV